MAAILAFAPTARPCAVIVNQTPSAGVTRNTGTFRWVRDAASGRLVCRYDAPSPEPEPLTFLKSA
jgi:hypothetical protein